MRVHRSRVWIAITALIVVAAVLSLSVILASCGGDKLAGKWKQKDGTGMMEIKKASGSTYNVTITDSATPGQSSTLPATKQGDTLHIKDPGGSGAEITLKAVSGGLEMKNGSTTITLVKQ
jgi:uncharacterized protein (DUF2147 family)